MASVFAVVREMLGRGKEGRAEEIAAVAAEEIEGTAGIVLCGYIGAEDASRVGEEICEWTERTVYDILMRKFSIKGVRFSKEELAKEVAELAKEEMEMLASIILSDYINTEEAIEAGKKVGEDVKAAVYDAFMRKN